MVYSKKHTNKTIINTIEKQGIMQKSITVKQKKRVARRSVPVMTKHKQEAHLLLQ